MTAREMTMKDAYRHARIALRTARYAARRLEEMLASDVPANCACITEDAKIAFEDGAIDAKMALAGFHRACQM